MSVRLRWVGVQTVISFPWSGIILHVLRQGLYLNTLNTEQNDSHTWTHLYKSALRCFFKYSDSTWTPTVSYSTECVSLSSGHEVRFDLKTHKVPSKSDSCEVGGQEQFAVGHGTHFVRSADGDVPGEHRTHDLDVNGEPLASVSTTRKNYKKIKKVM